MVKKSTLATWLIPILLTIASINGLIKAITGVRYIPLLIDTGMLLLLGLILISRTVNDHWYVSWADILATIAIGIALLQMLNPNIPTFQIALEGFRKFAFMLLGLFIGRYWLNSAPRIRALLVFMLLVPTALSIYGIKQFAFPSSLDYRLIELSTASPITYLMGGHIRAFSSLSGPFHLGIYLVFGLLLLSGIWLYYRKYRLLAIVLFIPQFVALILTVTKSNWFAFAAGLAVLIFINFKRPLALILRAGMVVVLIMIAIPALLRITEAVPQFSTVHQGLNDLINPLQAKTFLIRLNLWKEEAIPLIESSPWIGSGTGSAGEGLGYLFENTSGKYVISHNLYLKVWIEMGLLGLLIFLFLYLYIAIKILRMRQNLKQPLFRLYADWALAMLTSVAVAGLTGAILDAYPANLVFWIVLGIASSLSIIQGKALQHAEDRVSVISQVNSVSP